LTSSGENGMQRDERGAGRWSDPIGEGEGCRLDRERTNPQALRRKSSLELSGGEKKRGRLMERTVTDTHRAGKGKKNRLDGKRKPLAA